MRWVFARPGAGVTQNFPARVDFLCGLLWRACHPAAGFGGVAKRPLERLRAIRMGFPSRSVKPSRLRNLRAPDSRYRFHRQSSRHLLSAEWRELFPSGWLAVLIFLPARIPGRRFLDG